jgi:hypothetical protein
MLYEEVDGSICISTQCGFGNSTMVACYVPSRIGQDRAGAGIGRTKAGRSLGKAVYGGKSGGCGREKRQGRRALAAGYTILVTADPFHPGGEQCRPRFRAGAPRSSDCFATNSLSRSYRMQNVQRTFLSPWNPSLRFG